MANGIPLECLLMSLISFKTVEFLFLFFLIQFILYKKKPNAFETKSKLCINYCYWVFEIGSHYVPQVTLVPAMQPRLACKSNPPASAF